MPPPQRSARLYRTIVESGLASSVVRRVAADGAAVPLHPRPATANEGTDLRSVEAALLEAVSDVEHHGITQAELTKAQAQLRARLVFDSDSVTNIACQQIGSLPIRSRTWIYADGCARADRIKAVTHVEDVARAAREVLVPSNRTIGTFLPIAVS